MGNRTSRKLDPIRVATAQRVARAKHELAMKMVAERVKQDAEFAADVLKIAGDTLREEIKKDALETIARANQPGTLPIVDLDMADKESRLVPMQTDGGGEILVPPQELPDGVKDHGYILDKTKIPTDMKAVPVNVPVEVVNVPQAELSAALDKLSAIQAERLKAL